MQSMTSTKATKSKNSYHSIYRICAPEIFSIIENAAETISFFAKIENTAFINHRLLIDIRKIKVITPETVLYLLLFLDKAKKNKMIKISGNRNMSR